MLPVERGLLRTPDDEVRRQVIDSLMCNFKIPIPEVESAHGIRFADYFELDLRLLQEYADEGLVTIEPTIIRATPLGQLFVRNLAMCFDRYWREKHADEDEVFSRTV